MGIIPRAVQDMFRIIKVNLLKNASWIKPLIHKFGIYESQEQSGKEFLVKVSYLEIYKEELKDLLDPSTKEMHIREDEAGNISERS